MRKTSCTVDCERLATVSALSLPDDAIGRSRQLSGRVTSMTFSLLFFYFPVNPTNDTHKDRAASPLTPIKSALTPIGTAANTLCCCCSICQRRHLCLSELSTTFPSLARFVGFVPITQRRIPLGLHDFVLSSRGLKR